MTTSARLTKAQRAMLERIVDGSTLVYHHSVYEQRASYYYWRDGPGHPDARTVDSLVRHGLIREGWTIPSRHGSTKRVMVPTDAGVREVRHHGWTTGYGA